jgi:maltokinase
MTAVGELLAVWLPHQRWYAGKGTAVDAVQVERETPLTGVPGTSHVLLQVQTANGSERYQLLLGRLEGEVPQRLGHAVIGEADGHVLYDAVHDQAAAAALLARIADEGSSPGLEFHRLCELEATAASRVMGAEQSNTSIVYGDEHILKVFRRLQPGLNPDLELSRALADAGNPHVAQPLGWVEAELDGQATTLALLQTFQKHATEGWAMATASVRDLFAEADLHADEVGGDFAAESERLGAATASVHQTLREALPSGMAGPDQIASATRQLHDRLDKALEVVPDLEPYTEALRSSYDAVGQLTESVPIQRVHGDYHLGQVLRTQDGWVLLDFEGEPARPLAERTALMSPLRDVAGMLRSYDYAARHLLADRSGDAQLAYRAAEWAERNRQAFCDGYAEAAGGDPRDESVLLRAFELDKAVYEVVYEARNRPSWLPIPVGSIERLASSQGPASSGGSR